jgi:hypothetical protein
VNELDRQIADAFALMAVLLVFVFLLFTIIWQRVEELEAEPGVDDYTVLEARRRRFGHQARLLEILLSATLLTLLLVVPLSQRVIRIGIHFNRPFDTTRAGLLLVDLFLVALVVGCILLHRRIGRQRTDLSEKISKLRQ